MAVYNEKDKSKWTKDGRHWYFRKSYRDLNGKIRYYKSKMFSNREEAENEELLFKAKRDNNTLVKFTIVATDYFKESYKIKKESTVYSYESVYENNIKKYFDDFYINNITVQNINFWKKEIESKGYKINYLNKIYNILKSIFDFAMKNYNLETNVVNISGNFKLKNDEVMTDEEKLKYITYEQFNKFISVIDDLVWKTFFIFLYYTGMRKGEVQALTWNDIDFNNNEIIVNKTLSVKTKDHYKITSTKNSINRKIKINKILKEQLITYKESIQQYSDFKETWFVFGCSRFMAQTTIDRKKHYYFNLAKVKEITIHEFRHSHVSLLINEYIKKSNQSNVKVDSTKFFIMMSNRMGHTIDVMQHTYMHLFPTIQNEIVDLLDNL